jgi:hypothetical protein
MAISDPDLYLNSIHSSLFVNFINLYLAEMYIRIPRRDDSSSTITNIFKHVPTISVKDLHDATRNGSCDNQCLKETSLRILYPHPLQHNNNTSASTTSSASIYSASTSTSHNIAFVGPFIIWLIVLGGLAGAALLGSIAAYCNGYRDTRRQRHQATTSAVTRSSSTSRASTVGAAWRSFRNGSIGKSARSSRGSSASQGEGIELGNARRNKWKIWQNKKNDAQVRHTSLGSTSASFRSNIDSSSSASPPTEPAPVYQPPPGTNTVNWDCPFIVVRRRDSGENNNSRSATPPPTYHQANRDPEYDSNRVVIEAREMQDLHSGSAFNDGWSVGIGSDLEDQEER